MNYKGLMRQKLLEQMYDRMSDEEKRMFIQMTLQNKSSEEIMQRLNAIDNKIDNKGSAFKKDLAANVLGNYIADASIYLLSRLVKMIR